MRVLSVRAIAHTPKNEAAEASSPRCPETIRETLRPLRRDTGSSFTMRIVSSTCESSNDGTCAEVHVLRIFGHDRETCADKAPG